MNSGRPSSSSCWYVFCVCITHQANLSIVNLINNKYEQSKECNEQALEIIQHTYHHHHTTQIDLTLSRNVNCLKS